jgi:hypothetical protein
VVLIRRILVAVIAIAILPATAEAIASPSPAEMTMVDQADLPCCPTCNTQGDLKGTTCVLKCMALAGAVLPAMTIAIPYIADGSQRTLVDDTLHGLARAPPTHPPPA